MFSSDRKHFGHIFREAQISKCLIDVLGCYGLLRLFLGYLICFRGYQGHELDTTIDEEITGIFTKRKARFVAEYFSNDFLDRCCIVLVYLT